MVDTDGRVNGTRHVRDQNSGSPDTASRMAKRTKPQEQKKNYGGSIASGVTAEMVRKFRTTMVVLKLKASQNAARGPQCRCDDPQNENGDFRQAEAKRLRADLGAALAHENVDLFKQHFHLLMEGEASVNSFIEMVFKSSDNGHVFIRHFAGELDSRILRIETMLERTTNDPATSFPDDLRRVMDMYMVLHACPHRHNFDRSEAMGGTDPGPPKAKTGAKKKGAQQRVRVPAAMGSKQRTRTPRIVYRGNEVCIEHEEFVQDIDTDDQNLFAYDVFSISPMDFYTFPWLSAFAVNFESYVFDELEFRFKTAASTSTAGKVIMATDFDCVDGTTFETKQTLLQWEGSVDGPAWKDLNCPLSRFNLNRVGPTRFLALDSSPTNERLSSAGNFYLATTPMAPVAPDPASPGMYLTYTIGELWVKYKVRLITPSLQPTTGLGPGVQVTTPQFASVQEGNIYTSSTKELFNGFPGTTLDAIRDKQEVDADAAGIYKVSMPAGSLMDQTGNPTTEARECLYFAKDCVGEFTFAVQNPSGYAVGGPIAVTSSQYTAAAPQVGGGVWAQIMSLFKDVPDIGKNTITGVINNFANNVGLIVGKLAVQKGTFWALRSIANFAIANNANNRATMRVQWRPTPYEDLMRGALVDFSERGAVAPPRRANVKPRAPRLVHFRKAIAPAGATNSDK